MNNETQWVRIERTFDAPLETVWQMWTDPAWFRKWYGPNGMQIPEAEMNLVVGGKRKICMESAERGMRMWFIGEFTEIEPPVRLVYTESMC
ncbi:MAG: SRPBCC domain-containing protein, partial [Pseudomonadota bacterium]